MVRDAKGSDIFSEDADLVRAACQIDGEGKWCADMTSMSNQYQTCRGERLPHAAGYNFIQMRAFTGGLTHPFWRASGGLGLGE